MKRLITNTETFLTRVNNARDEVLFVFIKPYWPRKIIPNYITYVRLCIGVVLFLLLFFLGIENKILILLLFCVGAITDLLDGSVARGINMVTEFGAILDATSDRVLIMPIAFYSLINLHKWLLFALILTEIINAIFSMYYNTKEIYLESNIFGKTKMFLLCIVLAVILFVFPSPPPIFFVVILWLSIPVSFLSIFSKIVELKTSHAK